VPLTALSEEQRHQAQDRFAMLRPYLEEGASLTQAARQTGVPLRTAQRWPHHYRQQGQASLARPPRHDRVRRRLPDLGFGRLAPPPDATLSPPAHTVNTRAA